MVAAEAEELSLGFDVVEDAVADVCEVADEEVVWGWLETDDMVTKDEDW